MKQKLEICRKNTSICAERGSIVVLFTLFAGLAVLFSIGYAIEVPTVHSADIRAQQALDIGAAHGIFGFPGYENSAITAYTAAAAVMDNTYGGGAQGNFSDGLQNNRTFRLWIPRLDTNGFQSPGTLYSLDGQTPDERQVEVLGRIFDVDPIDDFKNAVILFARFTPHRYLTLLPKTEIEVMSVAMLRPVLSYVLIDPAFSMDETNYNLVFGRSEDDTTAVWPVAPVMFSGAYRDPNQPWFYPAGSGLLMHDPVGGPPFSTGEIPPGDAQVRQKISRFYTSLCDSFPFHNFKGAAVDLLDWLTASSAYNSTTYVGLTGYTLGRPLVPIHPTTIQGGIVEHPMNPTDFPLPARAVDSNKGLHRKKKTAFDGYINSLNPAIMANRLAGQDGEFFTDDDQIVGTGVNRWDLCFCRGLYLTGQNDQESMQYQLAQDFNYSQGDDPELHHVTLSRRQRSNFGVNWCDDERRDIGGAGSPRDMSVDLGYSQSGSNNASDGDTPRNIISGLAMRVVDPKVETVMQPEDATWIRPAAPSRNDDPVSSPIAALESGARYLPTAISEARRHLVQARSDYSADPNFGVQRPIGRTAIIVYGFGIWSKSTAARLAELQSTTRQQIEQQAVVDLQLAIAEAVCDEQITVNLNLMPMSYYDRLTIISALEVIQEFEMIYDAQQRGISAESNSIPNIYAQGLENRCNNVSRPISPVFLIPTDYTEFPGVDDEDDPTHELMQKLQAATEFRNSSLGNISKILREHVFPL